MKPSKKVWYFILLLVGFVLHNKELDAQINVSPNQTATALAQKLAGQGVFVSNPVLNCPGVANGIFKVVSSNIGLDSGIVLTTGRAATSGSSYGVNGFSSFLASNNNGYPGDTLLTTLAGQTTYDACSLEFDVVPVGDTVSIGYVFSSEEYISAVCGPYNDAFAFFISGPGISGLQNLALVPGTNIPVTINSINNGVPGASGNLANCTAMGPGSPFTAYYQDNSSGITLTHKGLTTVLKAICPVTQCGKYHLKIVIADAGNATYDSGVFLEAGSLQSENYKVLALTAPFHDTMAPVCIKGCLQGKFRVKRYKAKPETQTIKFIKGGTAVSGVDYVPFVDSVVIPANDTAVDIAITGLATPLNGVKTLQLFILSPFNCTAGLSSIIDSALINIYDTMHLAAMPRDTSICSGDSIVLRVSGDSIYTYSWLPALSISSTSIGQPVVFPVSNISYTVIATVPGTSCPARQSVSSVYIRLTPSLSLLTDTAVCGNSSFTLTPNTVPADNLFYSYSWTGPDGFMSTLKNAQLSNVTTQNEGTYHLVVTIDSNSCRAAADIKVKVNIVDTPGIISPAVICQYTEQFATNISVDSILWYKTDGSFLTSSVPAIKNDELASYDFLISHVVGNCEGPKKPFTVEVKKCCDGNIYIPNAFTPNGDGRNDKFRPVIDYGYFIKNMAVYNRWGQVVYSGNEGQWDGDFGHTPANAGTYFYKIILGCVLGGTVERVGDIILIR